MLPPGWQLSVWISSVAGNNDFLDRVMGVLASNYFAPAITGLVVLSLWFGTRNASQREYNQKMIIRIAVGVALAFLVVLILNLAQDHWGDFWARPYDNHSEAYEAMNDLYWPLTDSSFPSNAITGLAAAAAGLWCVDRRASALVWILVGLWGFGRIYVGIHYPIDVAGGMLIGVLSAFVGLKLTQAADPAVSSLVRLGKRVYIA